LFLPFSRTSAPPAGLQREAVRRLERVDYRTMWTNNAVGGGTPCNCPCFIATERMVATQAIHRSGFTRFRCRDAIQPSV
jgi:hypothetical protein